MITQPDLAPLHNKYADDVGYDDADADDNGDDDDDADDDDNDDENRRSDKGGWREGGRAVEACAAASWRRQQ